MRRATKYLTGTKIQHPDFYPRSPCGERLRACPVWSPRRYFYPRSPCGERRNHGQQGPAKNYFYPRSPCGERPLAMAGYTKAEIISIHALLAESDDTSMPPTFIFAAFLSTLSLRRATLRPRDGQGLGLDFYPRSPCGERRQLHRYGHAARGDFYPRSPCGERLSLILITI